MKTKGLTLTEIMISVSIVGLIAATAIPAVTNFREDAYENVCHRNLQAIDVAKLRWDMDPNKADPDATEPTRGDLAAYIIGDVPAPVVAGALYDINDVMTPALCTYHGDGVNTPANYGQDGFNFSSLYDEWVRDDQTFMAGDADKDGDVDVDDLNIFFNNFGNNNNPGWQDGDFNDDGMVDLSDFAVLRANYGYGT